MPSIDAVMREVLHTLGNIDFENELELDKVDRNVADEDLKRYIKEKIRAAHRERRQPYVDLLNGLRRRRHPSRAA